MLSDICSFLGVNFCPGTLVRKYLRSGIAKDQLEELIYDGLVDASTHFNPKRHRDFNSYAYRWAEGTIKQYLKRSSRLRVVSLNQGAEDEGDWSESVAEPIIEVESSAWDKVLASFGSQEINSLIDAAFPESDKRAAKRRREVLVARWIDRLTLEETAKKVNLNSRSAAHWHCREAERVFFQFVSSKEGKELICSLLSDRQRADRSLAMTLEEKEAVFC